MSGADALGERDAMSELESALKRASRSAAGNAEAAGAARRVPARAAEEGLIDVAYAGIDSPVGPLVAAVTRRGLVRVAYEEGRLDDLLMDLALKISPRVLEAPSRVDEPRRQLEEYFEGRRRGFELRIDWRLARGFHRRILRATAAIPPGAVATYREVATAAGSARAVRAAGTALATNPLPIVVPCHRVIRTDGGLGGYTGGLERKRRLLRLERAPQA